MNANEREWLPPAAVGVSELRWGWIAPGTEDRNHKMDTT